MPAVQKYPHGFLRARSLETARIAASPIEQLIRAGRTSLRLRRVYFA